MLPALFEILLGHLTNRQVSYLSQIMEAIFAMTGAVSMLSISRISGIPYRTVQRFYAQVYDWDAIRFGLYDNFVSLPSEGRVLLTIDEVVCAKCGNKTFALDWFYSGLHQKTVKGVSALQISAVHTDTEQSYALGTIQLQKNEEDKKRREQRKAQRLDLAKRKAAAKAAGQAFVGKSRGRKKGSKNRPKTEKKPVDTHDSLLFRHSKMLLTSVINSFKQSPRELPSYLVGDGGFGNQHYVSLAKYHGLHLISKLKKTAKLELPFTGTRKPNQKGPNKKYGEQLDYQNLPKKYLVSKEVDPNTGIQTNIYQVQAYNREVSKNLLNIVIIEEVHPKTGKKGRVILFSTDLELDWVKIIKYYQLRFKIEIDFRDAKQYFGLRDFKNVKEKQVTNAINIAMTAKLVAQIRSEQLAQHSKSKKCSILDVKTYYRAKYYLKRVYKLMPQTPDELILNDHIFTIAQAEAIQFTRAA